MAANKDCQIPRSQFVFEERACAEATYSNRPWIGEWVATKNGNLSALSVTQYQVNGQLRNQDGTFEVTGRVDKQGMIQASISSSWVQAELKGRLPDLSARATGDGKIGSITSNSDTLFRMCK